MPFEYFYDKTYSVIVSAPLWGIMDTLGNVLGTTLCPWISISAKIPSICFYFAPFLRIILEITETSILESVSYINKSEDTTIHFKSCTNTQRKPGPEFSIAALSTTRSKPMNPVNQLSTSVAQQITRRHFDMPLCIMKHSF